MSFKEKLTRKAIPTVLISTVGALGLSGCGENWSEYQECPKDWSYGQESLTDPSQSFENLQASVSELRAMVMEKAGINVAGNTYTSSAGEELDSVVPNVFNRVGNTWGMGANTLVDAPSEVICYTASGDKNEYYFTPQAKAAIGSMKTVGITPEINSSGE